MAAFEFRILTIDYGGDEHAMAMQGLEVIEAVIAMNVFHFQRFPDDVCAMACGKIKYDTVNKDVLSLIGEIKTVPVLIASGIGLCFDIVAFDVAVRRFEGQRDARPLIIKRGGGVFHFVSGIPNRDRMLQYDPSEELERLGLAVTHQPDNCRQCAV